jgi:hypothetical protein
VALPEGRQACCVGSRNYKREKAGRPNQKPSKKPNGRSQLACPLTFDYPGYDLKFIQKRPCRDDSDHLFTLIYKFYSPATKYQYILHADYHRGDVFALKFYVKLHRHSEYKYSRITNRGDIGNILVTCAKVVPLLLKDYPTSSFCFAASRTIDPVTHRVENIPTNQRFKTYTYLASTKFGTNAFAHFSYEELSAYLMVNKNSGNVNVKEREIVKILSGTYINLPDIP